MSPGSCRVAIGPSSRLATGGVVAPLVAEHRCLAVAGLRALARPEVATVVVPTPELRDIDLTELTYG